jgi:hypothetical protein
VAKSVGHGLELEHVTISSYEPIVKDARITEDEALTTWEIAYKLQCQFLEKTWELAMHLEEDSSRISKLLVLNLDADIFNRTIGVTIPVQNISITAFTDPPSVMPTSFPRIKPTLSPTRNLDLPATNEPTDLPSWIPTLRPSWYPTSEPSPKPTKAPDIKAEKAVFDSTGLSILVTLDTATSQPGAPNSFDCANVLVADTTNLLGSSFEEGGSRCVWSSKLVLIIYTGYRATIMDGQNITFRDGEECDNKTICTEFHDYPIVGRSIPVGASETPVPLVVNLMGPAAIGACQDLSITMTYTGGAGRDLDVQWTIPENLSNYSGCNVTLHEEMLFVDAKCIAGSEITAGIMTFEVDVTN